MNKENNFKYDTINEEVTIPFMITWDILRRCSFDCTYCPPHRHDLVSPYPSRKELDDVSHFLIDYLKIIKKYRVSDEFNISLTGGEPTIYPEFIEFAEYLKSLKQEHDITLFVTLTSNGAFGDTIREFISKKLDWITISWHCEANNNAKQRTLDNILKINKDRKENQLNDKVPDGAGVGVNVMFHQKYFDECKELCEELHKNNVKFNPRIVGDSGSPNPPYSHHYTPDQLNYILNYWKKDKVKKEGSIHGRSIGRSCCSMRELTLLNSKNNDSIKTGWVSNTQFHDWYCAVNWFFLHINQHDNELLHHQTCKQLWDKKRGPICDLSKESLSKHLIWLKDKLETKSLPILQCSKPTCGCGMCVPKSESLPKFKNILSEHMNTIKVLA